MLRLSMKVATHFHFPMILIRFWKTVVWMFIFGNKFERARGVAVSSGWWNQKVFLCRTSEQRGETLFVDVKLLHGNWKLINSLISAVCGTLLRRCCHIFCARFLLICVEFQISSFTCSQPPKIYKAQSSREASERLIIQHNIVFAPRKNYQIKITQSATQLRDVQTNK